MLAVAALLGFLVSWSQYGLSLAVGGGTPMLPLLLVPYIASDPQVASVLALVFLAPALLAAGLSLALVARGSRGAPPALAPAAPRGRGRRERTAGPMA